MALERHKYAAFLPGGKRVTVVAANATDARQKLRTKYGNLKFHGVRREGK